MLPAGMPALVSRTWHVIGGFEELAVEMTGGAALEGNESRMGASGAEAMTVDEICRRTILMMSLTKVRACSEDFIWNMRE